MPSFRDLFNAPRQVAWLLSGVAGVSSLAKALSQAEALRSAGLTPADASLVDASHGTARQRLLGIRLGAAELRSSGQSEAYGNVQGDLRVWWSRAETPGELRWSFSPSRHIALGPPGVPAGLFAPKFELDRAEPILVYGADVDEWTYSSHSRGSISGTCDAIEVSRLPAVSKSWTMTVVGLDLTAARGGGGNPLTFPQGTFAVRRLARGSTIAEIAIDFESPVPPEHADEFGHALVWLLTFWAGRRVALPILAAPDTDAARLQGGRGELTSRRWRLLSGDLQQFLETVLPQWWAMTAEQRDVYGIGIHILSVVTWQPVEAQIVLCSAAVELFESVIDVDSTATANPQKLPPARKKEFNECLQAAIEDCMRRVADGAMDPEVFQKKIDQVRNLALKPPQADLWRATIEAHGVAVGPEILDVNKTRNAITHGRMNEPTLQSKIEAAAFCRWAVAACLLAKIGYRGPVFDQRIGEQSHTAEWGLV